LKGLKGKPDCVFIVDSEKEDIAVKESFSEGVELIAIADSNADPREINIVIPANDDAAKSVAYIVNCLKAAYNAGKKAR
jgi:small subunit ribosomal protein S2